MDTAKQPKILKLLMFWPDHEVIRAGKVPVVSYMADWPDNFVGDIQLAASARGQLLAPDNHHLVPVPVPGTVTHEVNPCDRSQIARAEFLLWSAGTHTQPSCPPPTGR